MKENNETISKKLRRIAKLYTNCLSRDLEGLKINRYFDILLTLSAQTEPVTQNKLALLMHIDKSRMVAIVNYLSQKGYVYTERNPVDRREHFAFLSEAGKTAIPLIKNAVDKNNGILKTGINDFAFNIFSDILTAIEQNLCGALRGK